MSYYQAGDFTRSGGYYRGYYAAGGFWSSLGSGLHSVLSNPVTQLAATLVPGIPGLVLKAATGIASHTKIVPDQPAVAPAIASVPGHAAQAAAGGAMMPSHVQLPPAGTPGHQAHRHAAGGAARHSKRRASSRRTRRSARRRSGGRRRSRRRPAGDARDARGRYTPWGDVESRGGGGGATMVGGHHGHRHHAPRKHRRHRGGGRVTFTTKDGRRVSFNAR